VLIGKLKVNYEKKNKQRLRQEDKGSLDILLEKFKTSNKFGVNNARQTELDYKPNTCDEKYRLPKYKPNNSNYSYVKLLLRKLLPRDSTNGSNCTTQHTTNKRLSYPLYILHKIYKPKKFYRFSKQFINTYTVAFMIIYFFTVFLLRMSSIFGNKLVSSINSLYQYLILSFNSDVSLLKTFENHNLFTEFMITCILTSGIIVTQLILSIKNFKQYVFYLRRCTVDNTTKTYINLWKTEKEANVMIVSNSLHFPGYLIAHLVYGYWLIFCILFIIVIVFKFLFYFPQVLSMSTQIFLPLFILILLKLLSVKFLTRTVFLDTKDNTRRMTNLTPYYTMVYFNFFFDCFLGFVECLNRIWQTTIVSLFFLPRLDISMFDEKNKLLLQQLDKGHLAYINFVHMEW
jgi:hypothetical protein